jgi:hypothetical protein
MSSIILQFYTNLNELIESIYIGIELIKPSRQTTNSQEKQTIQNLGDNNNYNRNNNRHISHRDFHC